MKILCIGNNTVDTDIRTAQLAQSAGVTSYGLLSELDGPLSEVLKPGYYHSSVYDIEYHRLLSLAQQFDQIIILDQPNEEYSHPDSFYKTIRLANELTLTNSVVFLDPTHATAINFFEELVKTNKSFCIFPFIELLTNNRSTTVCCRSSKEVTRLADLTNFQTDPHYKKIRDKMVAGELVPEHCSFCYKLENQGILSARIQETVEWANRLGLKSVDDVRKIQQPAYYEVRPSNICNLQCRTCSPHFSHLIAKEYKTLKFVNVDKPELEYTNFDFINFTNLKKLYVAGGEPTAMIEFYDFLDRCIADKQIDFELLINTNGTKLSDRFKEQLTHFRLATFIISIDGYDSLNHYIRWPSNWARVISNVGYLYKNFSIAFNVTVSIYNILTLHELLSFLDSNFPRAIVHCQFAETPNNIMSATNFPYPSVVVDNIASITNLNCYKNDKLLSSFIDGIIAHYSHTHTVDVEKLQAFFEFNDKLDASRNIALKDYIPELEQARKLVYSAD